MRLESVFNLALAVVLSQLTIESLLANDCNIELMKQLFLTFLNPRIYNSICGNKIIIIIFYINLKRICFFFLLFLDESDEKPKKTYARETAPIAETPTMYNISVSIIITIPVPNIMNKFLLC